MKHKNKYQYLIVLISYFIAIDPALGSSGEKGLISLEDSSSEKGTTSSKKRKRSELTSNLEDSQAKRRRLPSEETPKSGQVYGITTYDALFKWVLSKREITSSFMKAFIPNLHILSAERLDEHMNPVQELQRVRKFLHDKETHQTAKELTNSDKLHVAFTHNATKKVTKHEKGTSLLNEFLEHFEDIKRSFPHQKYDGTMDFVCQLDNGKYAIVEMQVIPQDYWDYRALAYAAHVYGGQLKKGGKWSDNLKKVIAINILGGGRDDKVHWQETPKQYFRHYKFQEQRHKPSRFIDGIELFQYSIMNAPKDITNQEQSDWITFFKNAHYMTKEQVAKQIQTPAVKRAFEFAELNKLPNTVRRAYEEEDKEYSRYSEHTEEMVKKGEEKGRKEGLKEGLEKGREEEKERIARNLLDQNIPLPTISAATGLSVEHIQKLQKLKLDL